MTAPTARDLEAHDFAEELYRVLHLVKRNDRHADLYHNRFIEMILPTVAAALAERERATVEMSIGCIRDVMDNKPAMWSTDDILREVAGRIRALKGGQK